MNIARQFRGDPEAEFDALIPAMQGGFYREHDAQGKHTNLTAKTIKLFLNGAEWLRVLASATMQTTMEALRIDNTFLHLDLRGGMVVNLDTNNNSTSNYFAIRRNGSTSESLMSVHEDGHVEIPLGYVELSEMTEPDAPSSNKGRLFIVDNAGKSSLRVRFASGATQVIATEP